MARSNRDWPVQTRCLPLPALLLLGEKESTRLFALFFSQGFPCATELPHAGARSTEGRNLNGPLIPASYASRIPDTTHLTRIGPSEILRVGTPSPSIRRPIRVKTVFLFLIRGFFV